MFIKSKSTLRQFGQIEYKIVHENKNSQNFDPQIKKSQSNKLFHEGTFCVISGGSFY